MTSPRTTRRPDDKPFDFDLDAVKSEVELRPWVIKFAGRRWTFAHLQSLSIWPLMDGVGGGDVATVVASFRAALGEAEWEEFRKIELPQFKMTALFNAYEKHCGTSVGESEASASS